MSEIEDIAEEYRRQLNANEKQVLTEIARSWAKVVIKMEGEYKSLLEVVEQAKAEGQTISRSWLYSLTNYRHMKAQAEELTKTFADGTVDRVQAMKRADAQLGLDQANDMLGVLAPDSPDWTRLNVSGLENMSANLADGSPLKKLIMESAKESAKEVEDTLLNGIAIGQGASHIGWVMSQLSNLPYERAYRIARTEIARAYRSASHEQYKKSGIIVGYRRMCYKPTACFACLMMDGEFYPIGQGALQDHPNGKCTPIPVLEGHENDTPRWQTGREWFDGLAEDDQRKLMGNERFDAWKGSGLDIRKTVYNKESKVWGSSPQNLPTQYFPIYDNIGKTAANGIVITDISNHFLNRLVVRDVTVYGIDEAITEPAYIGEVVIDGKGRPIQALRGRQDTVFINPITGVMVTCYTTSGRAKKKYGIR